MNQNNIPLYAGGLTAPLWVDVLSDWLGLLAVSLTVILLLINIWKSRKK